VSAPFPNVVFLKSFRFSPRYQALKKVRCPQYGGDTSDSNQQLIMAPGFASSNISSLYASFISFIFGVGPYGALQHL